MPNHVYNFISVEQEYADQLEAISKVRLAEIFKPRPKAYDDTQSPMPKKKDDPYKYELGKILEKHHGFDNWYDCAQAGLTETKHLMQEIGPKVVNRDKITVSFVCKPTSTT